MALKLLQRLSTQTFPVTITEPCEVAAVKGLHSSELVKATVVTDAQGAEMALVHRITAYGLTALKAKSEANPKA